MRVSLITHPQRPRELSLVGEKVVCESHFASHLPHSLNYPRFLKMKNSKKSRSRESVSIQYNAFHYAYILINVK